MTNPSEFFTQIIGTIIKVDIEALSVFKQKAPRCKNLCLCFCNWKCIVHLNLMSYMKSIGKSLSEKLIALLCKYYHFWHERVKKRGISKFQSFIFHPILIFLLKKKCSSLCAIRTLLFNRNNWKIERLKIELQGVTICSTDSLYMTHSWEVDNWTSNGIVRLTSINLQKKILKSPVF